MRRPTPDRTPRRNAARLRLPAPRRARPRRWSPRRGPRPPPRPPAARGGDLEKADVAGAGDVRAAAQLARGADVQYAHLVAVLLAEQGHGTAFDGVVELHD